MHEWALAEGVIKTALKVAEENNASEVVSIRIKIGSLQQIDREVFDFALEEISNDTPAENSEIKINTEEAILKCRVCGEKWGFNETKEDLSELESESIHFVPDLAHTYIRCPNCNSPDFSIEEGRGVWLDSVELES
ncbi:MAG: hydrogenase nickel incorporation protein HypA [Hadesarchaea archaeon]|nr:hydrogenase nickel incorporation protein HypA [Hadesarchaea archaeon]